MGNLFEELKRRNVFRVGVAYLVVGWLMIEVVDTIAPRMAMPDWVPGLVIILVLVGLPITLFLAWAFEMTPDGVKKAEDVDPEQSITPQTGQGLNRVIAGTLVLAVAFIAWDKLGPASGPDSAQDTVAEVTEISIAVLPFVNMSSDPEQEYFSDGISEELLNVLTRVDGLKVAARTSSFSFKGQNKPVGEIAEVLGVGHILEGSVRKSGNQIRITAQLIRVSDGFHMWSDTYDRELVNIFAIQDEIAQAIVAELRIRLTDMTEIASSGPSNTEAYQEYLKGRYFWNLRTTEDLYQAVEHFARATALDPEYADAWVGLSEAWVVIPGYEYDDTKVPEQQSKARQAAERALALNPRSGRAYTVLAEGYESQLKWRQSLAAYEKAIALEPNSATTWQWYGTTLSFIGRYEESLAAHEKALELDPLSRIIGTNAARALAESGNYDAALEQITRTISGAPDFKYAFQELGFIQLIRHEFDDARAAFRRQSELEGANAAPRMAFVDQAEAFALTGEPGDISKFYGKGFLFEPFAHSLVMVCVGQYDAALDIVAQLSGQNYNGLAVINLRRALFQEAMGDMPRYQELVKRLTSVEIGD